MNARKKNWWAPLLPPTILSIITVLTYIPSLQYAFQFDDIANIQKYFDIRHDALGKLFMSGSRWISYWLNALHYSIGSFDPFSYRLGNLAIHVTNGLLLYAILLMVLKTLKNDTFFKRNAAALAFLTALLFLLHPVQTQTISYVIQGQLEGLALLSILSTIICFLFLQRTTNRMHQWLSGSLLIAFSFLACGTKEITVVIPPLLLLIDWFFVAQGSWKSLKKRLLIHSAVFLVIVTCYVYLLKPKLFMDILGLQFQARNNIGNIITKSPEQIITPLWFFISQFKVILHYLWIFVWPFNLCIEYDWKLATSFFSLDAFIPFLFLMSLSFVVGKILYRNPTHLAGFGALWFIIAIAPRSSIIPSSELMADYKTYIASIGFLFLLAAFLIYLFHYLREHYQALKINNGNILGLAFLCITLSSLTIRRNTVWRSGLEFWENIIQNAPNKARGYNNYGVELSQVLNRFDESIAYFKQAITMDPHYPDPYNNLAVAYAQLHRVDEAIAVMQQSLVINRFSPEGYNNLASFLLEKKDYDQVKICLNTAIKLRPHYGKAYFNMGKLHLELNDKESAWVFFKKACMEADLDNVIGFDAYAKVSLNLQKYDDAIFAYKKIIALDPHSPDGEFNLANAHFFAQQYTQALNLYLHLARRNENDGRVWNNMGETYIKMDQILEATACYEKAVKLQPDNAQAIIRIAACHERLGNPAHAKSILTALLSKHVSPEIDTLTTTLLDLVNKRYQLA